MNNANSYERYHRQTILPGFGEESQKKLLEAKVLVVGAAPCFRGVKLYWRSDPVGLIISRDFFKRASDMSLIHVKTASTGTGARVSAGEDT